MMILCRKCKHWPHYWGFDEDDDHEYESNERENEQIESSNTDFEDRDIVTYYQW